MVLTKPHAKLVLTTRKPIVDIPAIDDRLEPEDDQSLFNFIVRFLETSGISSSRASPLSNIYALVCHLDHIYEPRASFYTLLQVHQAARFLDKPELAAGALAHMTQRAYRIHRVVNGVYDQKFERNDWRLTYRRHCPGSRGLRMVNEHFVAPVGSFIRCLVEIAEAIPEKGVVQGGPVSMDVPKDVGVALVTATYMLWGQLEQDEGFRDWWLTGQGRLFRGLILEHREPEWEFGAWRNWLEVEGRGGRWLNLATN